jgi:lysozyme family protein
LKEQKVIEIKDDRKPEYETVYELAVDRSEYDNKPAFKPKEKKINGGSDEDESSETDEEFGWYFPEVHDEESHVCFVNHRRKTLLEGE